MDKPTFRSRIAALAQKSRKALRLYTSMSRSRGVQSSEYSEVQLSEWREINAGLLRELTEILAVDNSKKLASEVFSLRDKYYEHWRGIEADLHLRQKELMTAAQQGDFVKAANLSRELVRQKARVQASQAAHHELQEVIRQSKIKIPTIELTSDREVSEPQAAVAGANVIPLRR